MMQKTEAHATISIPKKAEVLKEGSLKELRGGMDASQYKDYVLILLFVKYVSDKYAGQSYAPITIPKGGGFANMVALKGDKEIGDKINKIIGKLAEANDLKGAIDVADFNDSDKLGRGKAMVDRLSNLIAIFENPALDFSKNRTEGDDILGDAYEYLMRNFATQSGKSKGQFYTPAEVSRVIAQVIGISAAESQEQTLYDPTCGSGSLLLKAAAETPNGITIYGQEMDNATASDDLLQAFATVRLIDKYDVYQHLMTYWIDTMQDDVYMIADVGWLAANKLRLLETETKEKADIKIGKLKYKADFIPPALIIARYFAAEQQELVTLESKLSTIGDQMGELKEEHGGEGSLLEEAKNNAGNITKASAKARLKEIGNDPEDADEVAVLKDYLDLCDQESAVRKQIKAAQNALDARMDVKYRTLSEEEIKTLVVDDKWLTDLTAAVQTELEQISQTLTGRIKELAERYATPLPQICEDVDALSGKVDAHLERMGFVCN